MTSEHSSANRLRKGGILLVQCCHLPQFFYAASLLRRRLPGVRMDALVKRSAEVDFYLDKMSPFSSILNSDSSTLGDSGHERIVFPCFNRGYGRIKRVAWRLSGDRLELDYEAGLQPLSRLRLARSLIHSLHQPDASFREYFATFPHRPLEKNVLFIESCHSSLVKATEPVWKPVLSERCKLTRVSGEPLHRALRQLRNQHFDSSITFFSGETGFFGLKTLPFLLRVPRSVAVSDRGDFFYCTAGGLLRYLYHRFRVGSPVPGFIRTILFIQTEGVAGSRKALETLVSSRLFPDSEVVVLCRQEDAHELRSVDGVNRVFELRTGAALENWRTFQALRRLNPGMVSAILSGRPVFRKAKLLFLLFCDRPALVFNPGLECYFLRPSTIPRIFSRETFLLEEPAASRIAVVQTEHCSMLRESMARLRGRRLYPEAAITLVCKAEDAPALENLPGVDVVFHFPEGLAGWIRLARQLRKERPEVISLIFSGRRVFSPHKLWVLLIFPFRSKLAFNARLDAYWLGPVSWPRIFRKEPLLIESESRGETLLIQTDSVSTTMEALEYLLSVTAARGARIRLLCRAEDRHRYLSRIPAEDVSTWTPGWSMDNLKLLIGLCRARDAIAATLSGQPIFRLQKLAFFLLPARDRLVFNENSDCFYMARSGFARALRLPSRPASYHGRGRTQLLHQTLKIALWIPRFAYLLGWLTIEKLKRARHLAD